MSERIGLLGTDGFRGVFEKTDTPGTMNPTTVAGLTHALISMRLETGEAGPVVIGGDTRIFNGQLEQAAVAGAVAAGMKESNILRLGIAPTPAILRTAQERGAIAAVALTASHNSAEYGGWKGTIGSDKPSAEQARLLEGRYWQQVERGLVLPLTYNSRRSPDYLERYVQDVVHDIEATFGEKPLADKLFVVDTAYGAANCATPAVLEALGATVERFANDTSQPINKDAGATNLDGVRQFLRARPELVMSERFVGALINDGDADRFMGIGAHMGNSGKIEFDTLDGNRVLELLAKDEIGVVGTDYTNDASVLRIEKGGTKFEFCRNGDTNVTLALKAHGAPWHIGSEFTGHHVDLDWLSSGDGVRTAAWVAAYVARYRIPFAELCRQLPLFPERMRTLPLAPRVGRFILSHPRMIEMLVPTQTDRAAGFRNVTRPSGTEPKFRIWGVGAEASYVDWRTEQIATTAHQTAMQIRDAA